MRCILVELLKTIEVIIKEGSSSGHQTGTRDLFSKNSMASKLIFFIKWAKTINFHFVTASLIQINN
jgi:hypothetical protein